MSNIGYSSRMSSLPSAVEGVVVNNNDPQQQGRVQVWCPGIDGENVNYDNLPWAKVSSMLAGQVLDYPAGSNGEITKGPVSYGWWCIPPINAIVEVMFLYNDPNQRRVIGSTFGDHGNRSLPVGRNRPDIGVHAPVSDTLDPIQPQTRNLNDQFGGKLTAPEAISRGAYERQAAQDKNIRDGSEGYQKNPYMYGDKLSPQTYSFTTPGRHSLIFQDNPENGRVRLKSADGHQIILDDANERIYISSCSGKTWIEMDKDGHIHVYGSQSISVAAGKDINLSAGNNINMNATKSINISAGGDIVSNACGEMHSSGKLVNIESKSEMNLLASGNIIESGSSIHLNGPTAASAKCPTPPSVIPNHEPWVRPVSSSKRGPNWKA